MSTQDEVTEFAARLREKAAKSTDEARKLSADVPGVLYHYTSATGLLGILDSKKIWATDYRFLNDASEIEYGVSLLREVSTRLAPKVDDPVLKEILVRSAALPNIFERELECYVACFCADAELLHQWRVYAENGGGVAIGFSAADLKTYSLVKGTMPRESAQLVRVIYDRALQVKLITNLIDDAMDLAGPFIGQNVADVANFIPGCAHFIRWQAMQYLMTFKHPSFEVEQEWRLCFVPFDPKSPGVQFRDGAFGLTPYVEIDPCLGAFLPNMQLLPLVSVTHGPVSYPETAKYALRKLLRSRGYGRTEIHGSRLPFRIPAR